MSWQDAAACRGMDTDLFFPGRGEPVTAAVAVCHRCPVRARCLTHALTHREKQGIWGGTSEQQRRRIRRRRGEAA